jgi:hypothetical protein
MSENWNALTAHQKIEEIHNDLMILTTSIMELASVVSNSVHAQDNEKIQEITKRVWALGPLQIQRKMSAISGFPPAKST